MSRGGSLGGSTGTGVVLGVRVAGHGLAAVLCVDRLGGHWITPGRSPLLAECAASRWASKMHPSTDSSSNSRPMIRSSAAVPPRDLLGQPACRPILESAADGAIRAPSGGNPLIARAVHQGVETHDRASERSLPSWPCGFDPPRPLHSTEARLRTVSGVPTPNWPDRAHLTQPTPSRHAGDSATNRTARSRNSDGIHLPKRRSVRTRRAVHLP